MISQEMRSMYHNQKNYLLPPLSSPKLITILLFVLIRTKDCATSFSITPMTGVRPYAVNVELQIKPERHEDFLKIITYDAKQTMDTEPGALQFTIGRDVNKDNTFHLHEQYKSEDDFKHHCTTEHFAKWQEFCDSDPFLAPYIVHFYQCLNDRQENQVKTSNSTFCLNVELCVKDDVRDQFLSVIQNNQLGSRTNEALCIQYDYGESTTTPQSFYFHEQYIGENNGKEGFQAHSKSDHFRKWEEFAGTSPFTKDPVVSFYQSIPY